MDGTRAIRIRTIEAWPLSIPFATSFGVSRGAAPASDHALVRIEAEDGTAGLGEASPNPFYSYETQETVLTAIRGMLAPRLIGQNAFAITRRMSDLAEAVLGHPFARAAVEVALHDLVARALGIPLYGLLGGAMRERIPAAMPLGIDTVEATVEKATMYVGRGFQTIKLKIGRNPAEDLERLRAVREAIGPEIGLRVDANQGYGASDTLRWLREMERFGLEYIEQPVPAWDMTGMRRLKDALDTPIVADESVMSLHDAVAVIQAQAADGAVLKVSKLGIRQAIAVAEAITAAGLFYELSEMGATSVGTSAALHVAAALPQLNHSCEIIGPFLYRSYPGDATPLTTGTFDGAWPIPEGTGHGAGIRVTSPA